MRQRRGGVHPEHDDAGAALSGRAATFGYTFYLYEKLSNAARTGARYASTLKYDSATTTPTTAFRNAVQGMTVYGDPNASSGTPVVPGLTTENVMLTVQFTKNVPTGMTVAVTGYQLPVCLGRITLNNKPFAWFPFTGLFGPP